MRSEILAMNIRFFYLVPQLVVGLAMFGCGTNKVTVFPNIIGASSVPRGLDLCNDYGSRFNYAGDRYFIRVKDAPSITQHEGMDFCAPQGTPVVAAADGQIIQVGHDNPAYGGWIMIETAVTHQLSIETLDGRPATLPVYVHVVHIDPIEGLARGQRVTAGDVIARVGAAGKPYIGPRSHVHFSARTCESHWCHIDPNEFWQNGPGKVTCFDPNNRPSQAQIVAPLKC